MDKYSLTCVCSIACSGQSSLHLSLSYSSDRLVSISLRLAAHKWEIRISCFWDRESQMENHDREFRNFQFCSHFCTCIGFQIGNERTVLSSHRFGFALGLGNVLGSGHFLPPFIAAVVSTNHFFKSLLFCCFVQEAERLIKRRIQQPAYIRDSLFQQTRVVRFTQINTRGFVVYMAHCPRTMPAILTS